MLEHTWELVTIDGGHVGTADIYICRRCAATGRVEGLFYDPKRPPQTEYYPFLAGPALDLPKDCDEARAIVVKLKGEQFIKEHHADLKYMP